MRDGTLQILCDCHTSQKFIWKHRFQYVILSYYLLLFKCTIAFSLCCSEVFMRSQLKGLHQMVGFGVCPFSVCVYWSILSTTVECSATTLAVSTGLYSMVKAVLDWDERLVRSVLSHKPLVLDWDERLVSGAPEELQGSPNGTSSSLFILQTGR